MKTITWNTGRQYTRAGQIMVAELNGSWAAFADQSRMIEGIIHGSFPESVPWTDTARQRIMAAYDHNVYTHARTDDEQDAIEVLCSKCGSDWDDIYQLTGYQNLNVNR